MKSKTILTVCMMFLLLLISSIWKIYSPLLVVGMAADQLNSSDLDYGLFNFVYLHGGTLVGLMQLAIIAFIAWIWIPKSTDSKSSALAILIAAFGIQSNQAEAYYETRDMDEYIQIMPNQTAFAIPEMGDTKNKQVAFMSEEFLKANKVAAKRFKVPHMVLNTKIGDMDKWIPSVKLLLVDRTPYSREWIDGKKGSSVGDQGFEAETSDSISVHFGIAIGASVKEEDAATFVYYFGSSAPAQSTDPNVIYSSVIYGRSLENVMDTHVHSKVQTLLSAEIGSKSTESLMKTKGDLIKKLEEDVIAFYKTRGITIDYIGLATGLGYESTAIQDEIDKGFINDRKAANLEKLRAVQDVQMREAEIRNVIATAYMKEQWAKTGAKAFPNVPSFVVMSDGLANMLLGIFGNDKK